MKLTWHVPVTVITTLWSYGNIQVSADCSTDPPPIIPDDQLPFIGYYIVVDAGSSGSRIHVYSWKKVESRLILPDFRHVLCWRTKPGVSDCQSDSEIKDHVVKLIDAAKKYVPEKLHSKSTMFFMATAGMRMMLEDKANNATKYIDRLLSDPEINPFRYKSPDNARILSGEEEGIFAWIAANYLSNVFNTNGTRSFKTRGILELGGASTQIAFVPPGNILANKFPVRMAGVVYSVYVHSYLIYGQEEVDRWIRRKVVEDAGSLAQNQSTFENPCLLNGDSAISPIDGRNITFVGQGDPEQCLKLLDRLIYRPLEAWRCNPKPCAIGATYQPTIHSNMDFYVVGAFLHSLNSMKVVKADGTFVLDDIKSAANEFCKTPIDELAKRLNTKASFLSRQCLTGLYMPLLFQKAYGFKKDTRQLKAPFKADNSEIEWPIGAVLYEYERQLCDLQSGSQSLRVASVEDYVVRSTFYGLSLVVALLFSSL